MIAINSNKMRYKKVKTIDLSVSSRSPGSRIIKINNLLFVFFFRFRFKNRLVLEWNTQQFWNRIIWKVLMLMNGTSKLIWWSWRRKKKQTKTEIDVNMELHASIFMRSSVLFGFFFKFSFAIFLMNSSDSKSIIRYSIEFYIYFRNFRF